MKTMFGKRYPNCVKKEEVEIEEKARACWDTHEKVGMKMKGGKMVNDCRPKNRVKEERKGSCGLTKPVEEETIDEAVRVNENGNVYLVKLSPGELSL